jgi:mono/diheme cytochrome c family protein
MRFGPAALLGALVAVAGCSWVGQPPRQGEDLYREYCASCHGVSGRADDPALAGRDPRPSDLTRSTAALPELMRIIDGRRTVRGHMTGAAGSMPVWGDVFEASLEGESRQHRNALRNVEALAEYVVHLRGKAARAAPAQP